MRQHMMTGRKQQVLFGESLSDLMAAQTRARPDHVAVSFGDRHLTYRELVRDSRRLAGRLWRSGVTRDRCVGLYAEPSLELMVGVWGILFGGGAYLPLSPDYPKDRLRFMVEDSEARIVVTQEHLVDRLTPLLPPRTAIVTMPAGNDAAPPETPVLPEDLAYVIYTSGSTGRPKGVMIEQHSVVSQLRWLRACGHLGPGVTVLQKTPISFDAAQWEVLAPAVGGRVVMCPPGLYRDPRALVKTIVDYGVTALQCVPTLLQALVELDELALCSSLRRVFSGGEALSRSLARQVTDLLPDVVLVNLYGPTECTINTTAHVVDRQTIGEGMGTIPIGVPVHDTQCYILDDDMAPVDIGEIGQLYIGGAQVARGYLNRPDLTDGSFLPSPFVPTERLYRTGDLRRQRPPARGAGRDLRAEREGAAGQEEQLGSPAGHRGVLRRVHQRGRRAPHRGRGDRGAGRAAGQAEPGQRHHQRHRPAAAGHRRQRRHRDGPRQGGDRPAAGAAVRRRPVRDGRGRDGAHRDRHRERHRRPWRPGHPGAGHHAHR
ncbi:amino acid adenylation domain-containing protein [Actinokineospora sp. 24-640]